MGELSTSINDALLAIDLNTVELVTLQSKQKQTGRETQVVILNRLRKRIHKIAKKRNCSMNQLVNSVLLAYYSKNGQGKLKRPTEGHGPSMHSYDTTSELERRELHQMLSGLSAMQSVSIEAEEPNGTYYEYDRNLRATVKVTPDGERTPVEELETSLQVARRNGPRKIAHEEITT
jgi:hypothetical protein